MEAENSPSLQSNKVICFCFKEASKRQGTPALETKALLVHSIENSMITFRISALVVFAKSLQMMQWAQVTLAEAVGCIKGQAWRTKNAELFQQTANHCSKPRITQPCPPAVVLLQSP